MTAGGTGAGPAALGIDIGGTKVAGGVVASDGTVAGDRPAGDARVPRSPTPRTRSSPSSRSWRPGTTASVVGVGVGAAGWFDRTGDTVLFSPHLAWRNSTLRQDLAVRLQRPLWVGNDADAAAWAEYRYGAARGADLALMITLGTGIGGGIVLDGRLRRGSHGVAGEWGHMRVVPDGRLCACGNRGCWEQYASGTALAQTAREVARTSPRGGRRAAGARGRRCRSGSPVRTSPRAAADGDPLALELVTDVGQWLGQGIADLAAILDPEVVVIGGGVSRLGELVLAPAREPARRGRCRAAASGPARGWSSPSSARRRAWSARPTWSGMRSAGPSGEVVPSGARRVPRRHDAAAQLDGATAPGRGVTPEDDGGHSSRASCSRNRPMSVMIPIAWALPRSASLVTVAGLMSTHTSGIDAGRMFPVAIECSIVATMIAKPTSGSSARIARWPSITSV